MLLTLLFTHQPHPQQGGDEMGALTELLEEQNELYVDEHFIYASWKHGTGYVNNRFLGKDEFRSELQRFSLELMEKTIDQAHIDTEKPVLIIGIKTLGATMAKTAAEAYNKKHGTQIRHAIISYEKKVGHDKVYYWDSENAPINHLCTPQTQVIWMDDLLNLSSTLESTRDIFEHLSAIAAVAVLFDRSNLTADDINVPALVSLEKHAMRAYAPEVCPMCKKKQPIVENFGRGNEYRKKYPNYPGGYKTV